MDYITKIGLERKVKHQKLIKEHQKLIKSGVISQHHFTSYSKILSKKVIV